jgi:phosphatidylglycerophosphate synthase
MTISLGCYFTFTALLQFVNWMAKSGGKALMHGPIVKPIVDVYLVGKNIVTAFSLSQRERLRRSLSGKVEFKLHDTLDEACRGEQVLVVRDDWVIEKRILLALLSGDSTIMKHDASEQPIYVAAYLPSRNLRQAVELLEGQPAELPALFNGLRVATPAEICGSFERELRKPGAPVAVKLTEETREGVERALFQSSYKGATDFVTKYVWPEPALIVVRALAKRKVTPNAVTVLSLVCVIATFYFFCIGAFWWGIASAFLMAFLDTVDGKLARVTLTATRFGHFFDHGIDWISPPFWWAAWFVGLLGSSYAGTEAFQSWGWLALWTIMANYWLVRAVETLFARTFGFHVHIWKPVDFAFRQVTTRRNVNVVILTIGLLFGRPDIGFIAVALWSIASLLFHGVRYCQARLQRAGGGQLASFLS